MRTSQVNLAALALVPGASITANNGSIYLQKTLPARPIIDQSSLPDEIWSRVFSFLDPAPSSQTTLRFSQVCKRWHDISKDPHSRVALFVKNYGTKLALYAAFKNHRAALTVPVARLLRNQKAAIPRFLVQLADKEYHRTDRGKKSVSIPLYVYFIQEGYNMYGNEAAFKEDDVAKFERLLYTGPVTSNESDSIGTAAVVDAVRTLLDKFGYLPVRGVGSPLDETVFLLSKLDISLIPKLVSNGLDLASVNDQVLERVLWRADITDAYLQTYLNNGFKLTSNAIQKGLQIARQATLDVLVKHVSQEQLAECAKNTVIDMFGPSTGRSWHWVPESVDFIIETFNISEDTIRTALFTHPKSPRLTNGGRPEFPATRCYMKTNPCPVWRWILRNYGPHHEFTRACYDDALSRAAADRDLHLLHDEYLEAGVRFYPRHVKILACRLLHRDMTANALHLLQALREQVADDRDAGCLSDSERDDWMQAVRVEVVDNDEWNHRMRTTQLEGGARGGAYRISRPPEDALRFLEESKELLTELLPPIPAIATVVVRSSSGSRRTSLQRSPSMRSWVKRMGIWWKEQCEKGVWGVVENVV
ncbi:hypothetical protein PhCBS80983_g02355 [Powellomyces hirtus]|uniref:F-box domain-containing protein n=1 Tax=Powellomyces hirtus TaxID=109895 RepID=A0A507E732_9FUNG|nr:hypothetical protein PhCBS80983_g02355 [Powellomyces hirtus]